MCNHASALYCMFVFKCYDLLSCYEYSCYDVHVQTYHLKKKLCKPPSFVITMLRHLSLEKGCAHFEYITLELSLVWR